MSRRVLAAILLLLAGAAAFALDQPVARWAMTAGPVTLAIFRAVTWFGQGGVVLIPTGMLLILLLWLRPRLPSLALPLNRAFRGSLLLFAAVAGAGIVNDALKVIMGRARPRLWIGDHVTGFHFFRFGSDYASFPSGHTATSVAAAIVLGLLFPRARLWFAAFAGLIAVSRLVLDAHYLSDVVAGAIVGGACALAAISWLGGRSGDAG
jgi:undecaprenyl-diphosphatase